MSSAEQQLLPVGSQHVMGLTNTQAAAQPGAIALSTLIDYIIQRTYHDLQVLSELLPRKTDMEKKIEIVQFASRTRQLFVRLLALVKWANSASKVDKCGMISSFLDQQAVLFVETADALARTARETLVHARLPSFSLPCAIDVLTTGTYPRLPACIKEKIVPPDPISLKDKEETLKRLDQIIEYRHATSELPLHMRNLTIENGRVKFFVKHEFSATLTVMGDGPDIPWRLLDIDILVEDPETGAGKNLVHSLQVNYIHQLVQSRLIDNEAPLHDLYNCLHSFCQSLQLEVLHSQAQRLIQQRLRDHVKIDEYTPGKCLRLSYWRDNSRKFPGSYFKLGVHVDEQNPSKPLQVSHAPQIQGSESIKVSQAIRSDHLSLEKLLIHTIQVRSTAKLKDLEREFSCHVPGKCELRDLPTVLYVPILSPCMATEKLSVAVNIQTGNFMVALGGKETDLTEEIEECLNGDHRELRKLLSQMRLWLGLKRCERSLHHIQAPVLYHLPLLGAEDHPISKLSQHKLFVRLAKQHNFYLVAEVKEAPRRSVLYKHHILKADRCAYDPTPGENMEDTTHAYLRPVSLVELDTFVTAHAPGAELHEVKEEPLSSLHRKRKLLRGESVEPPNKRQMMSPYFLPELSHIVSFCEDNVPFVHLASCLEQNSISHQGVQVEADGVGLVLTLQDMPPCVGIGKEASERLQSDLLSCKIRIQRKQQRVWCMEAIFSDCPVESTDPKEQGKLQRVTFLHELISSDTIDKTVHSIVDDWNSLGQLYAATLKFADVYKNDKELQAGIDIKSFNYKRLVLTYGPNKCYCVVVQFKSATKQLHVSFGTCAQATMYNCHTIIQKQLEHQLNETKSIALLAKLVMETYGPIVAIGKLSTMPMMSGPMMGSSSQKHHLPVPTFTVLPQTATHIRIVYRACYCLDVHLLSNKTVAIRDGAYSNFDTSKVVEGMYPIPQLKAFLNLYVDDNVCLPSRRRSTTEDDNPPSPIGMDTMDTFLSQQPSVGSPSTRKTDGLRFPGPMTPPSVQSNPHTPGSPSTRLSQQSNVAPSPSAALMGTPSPSTMLPQGSPNPALHVPSPSSFVPAPSPQSLGIHMPSPATQFISPQGMVEGGSPFPNSNLTMPSPGARNWPASPSMPGPSPASRHAVHSPGYQALHSPQKEVMSPPSRMLPQRSWAASIPTLLSHDALAKLLTQTPLTQPGGSPSAPCSPLERFLGSVFLRRHMQRLVQSDDMQLHTVQTNEKGVVMFKVDSLQFRLQLNPVTLQALQIKVAPQPGFEGSWEAEDIAALEKFFDTKVACAPFKANAMRSYGRLLTAPINVLKDLIKIIKIELVQDRSLNWMLQWCLTVPHGAPIVGTPAGTSAVVINVKGKILLILQLTRQNVNLAPGQEPQTLIVPILYDQTTNATQMTEAKNAAVGHAHHTTFIYVTRTLKQFTESNQLKPGECTLFPCVRDLLSNLVLPL